MIGRKRQLELGPDEAAAIALQGLTFLASDPGRLGRFLTLTGLGPQDIRQQAATSGFQIAVIDYLMADESLLLVFCDELAIRADRLRAAQMVLSRTTAQD